MKLGKKIKEKLTDEKLNSIFENLKSLENEGKMFL